MSHFRLDFLVAGPQRTGTTWLYEQLRPHASLCFPKDVKETMFFDHHFEKGADWYTWHFRHCTGEQRYGEVAPTYFDDATALKRVRRQYPDCRVVITLRDPTARAFSLYLHHRRKGRVSGSFEEAVEQKPRIVEAGRYARHLPRWLEAFGKERVLVVLLDEIKTEPDRVLKNVCAFLDIDPRTQSARGDKVNAASLPRFPVLARAAASLARMLRSYRLHKAVEWGKTLGLKRVFSGGEERMPRLTAAERAKWQRTYAEDIAFVESVVGRKLPAWQASGSDAPEDTT